MDREKKLQEIFNDDSFGLLDVKPSSKPAQNEDERLISSFEELNDFYQKNKREPEQGSGIQEHQLYARLKAVREDQTKIQMLKEHDKYGFLKGEQKKINSIQDIFADDSLGLLDNDTEGLFDLKHIGKQDDRADADFVAKRKPCKDFGKYESILKEVQKDLSTNKRKLLQFKEEYLREGDFYVLNGILLFLEHVDFEEEVQEFKSGKRVRKDGRTRIIFENGTESNMLYRSLYKLLLLNGKVVSKNVDNVNEEFTVNFSNITKEDEEAGYIYVLKSKSEKQSIKEIKHLYKIGYSKVEVEERIKNANQDPTYLMADVSIVLAYKCYNMNPQKLEQLMHNFFGKVCLNVDIHDNEGNRHTPREWFIAPLEIIDQAIRLIISGEILKYRYDSTHEQIVTK